MTQVFTNCRIATLSAGAQTPYGLIDNAALIVRDGRIAWVGLRDDCPAAASHVETIDLGGRLVTPGLIDCHTHLVFAGNRATEFEMRLTGVSYADIAKAGGGIVSSVRSLRAADFDTLVAQSLPRLDALIADGVAVVEIKSGYGLTIVDEMRMLRVARHLETLRPITIRTSWLAAHTVPPEYAGHADEYIDTVVIPGLRLAHAEGLVDAVDGYCETIAFSIAQMRRIFDAARALDLPVKLHAEQLSDSKAARLGADYAALSVDHLEFLDPDDVPALAQAGTVATLLPGAFHMLKETQEPPVAALRAHGVPMALATDCNPGTSPLMSLLTAMNMGCILFGLTPEEALTGTTRYAAKALGLQDSHGTIEVGKVADLAVWNCEHPAELSYWIGGSSLSQRVIGGSVA
ncbi:imidazolonepropionase [Algimonas porphyrae]|uniref:Imidazolonepropionase n=1 Tax=Algimonas porphyrae TaxID=1128113 RepID=A0ABQ5V339_9PROT|nr:imidazolonepropionase [Algimonas porphyrae]GLQ21392.1 imidazolonepropionase [Algimonas porphyrae]